MSKEMLKLGAKSSTVVTLQNYLIQLGYRISNDGAFGPATLKAVKDFQASRGLDSDGIVGAQTWLTLSKVNANQTEDLAEYVKTAKYLGVKVAAIRAVDAVESASDGFLKDGRPKILFERHWFYRKLKAKGFDVVTLAKSNPNLVHSTPGGYLGGVKEHQRLASAIDIDPDSALESCSWGSFQIMGFHWKSLGYHSVTELVMDLSKNDSTQLKVFAKFIKKDPNLLKALKLTDWASFAKYYNGPNYAINKYDIKLAEAYTRFNV